MARATRFVLVLCALSGCSPAETPPGTDTGVITPGTDTGTTPGTDTGTTPGTDGGTPSGFTCSTGTIIAGHPVHDAEPGVHANEGDPLTGVEGRPLGFREVIFVGDHLVTVVGSELWTSDTSAATPTVHRIAGNDDADRALLDGPCAGARFANLQDVAADAAGNLYVMDQTANAVLQVTDPFDDAACAVHYWAGTSEDLTDINPSDPPNVGETEGPGADAQFALPGRMAIDGSGNLYVWDEGNNSIRRIAADAAHTVSTLTELGDSPIVDGMAVMGSNLYLYQHDAGGDVYLESVPLAGGSLTELFRGGSDLFDFFGSLELGGLTTDGTDLFVFFKGQVFSVTDGNIVWVAGEGRTDTSNFDSDYDLAASHAADVLQLPNRAQFATAGAASWLTWHDGALYFVGQEHDPYVTRITCSR